MGESVPLHLPSGAESWSECVRLLCFIFYCKNLLGRMEKTLHSMSNHTVLSGHVLLLSASELLLRQEEGIQLGSCWQWPLTHPVLLLELLLLLALPAATASSSLCAHAPNLSSSLFRKTCRIRNSGTSLDQTPAPTILVPGLLIALCRAIGSSTSVSEIRHSLWLNLPTLTQT